MVTHPLFDERVMELFPGVTDEFIKYVPESIQAANIVLRPGPEGRETETTVGITFPDADSHAGLGPARFRGACRTEAGDRMGCDRPQNARLSVQSPPQ